MLTADLAAGRVVLRVEEIVPTSGDPNSENIPQLNGIMLLLVLDKCLNHFYLKVD